MKPTVFVEGGGAPGDVILPPNPPGIVDLIPNGAVGTRNALADSLYELFFKKAEPVLRIRFDILLSGGYGETIKKYTEAQYLQPGVLYFLMIDYQDIEGKNRSDKYNTIQKIVDEHCAYKKWKHPSVKIVEQPNQLFFMMQKMDAWILSQPGVIDEAFSSAKRDHTKATARIQKLRTKSITDVLHPDDEIRFLMGCYEEQKKGKWKKLKYIKIKTVIRLLPFLDIDQLQRDFDDVSRFVAMLKTLP